jgi:hypothetical protein
MIIWRGWGILAAVLLFGGLVAAQLVADAVGGKGTYAANTFLYAGFGLIVGGGLTFLFARWEQGRNPPRVLIDKETGQEVTLRNRSELFFVPMKYWGLLGIGAGVVAIIAGLFGAT